MKRTYKRSGFGVTGDLTVLIKLPDWIKKAKRNRIARVKRFAKKHSMSFKKAEGILEDRVEDSAQSYE